MEIIFTEKKKTRTVTLYKPVVKSWSNKIEIDKETRYYHVTETAWDLIREKTKSKCKPYATRIEEKDDELLVFLSVQIKQQEEKKPSD
jgi:hypothetical protein